MSLAAAKPSIWNTLEADPEVGHLLRAPLRLARGVRLFAHKDGVVVAGGPTTELLSGYGARSLLARLVPMLDGTKTIAEIEAANDIDPQQIREAVANLFMSGVLRTGPMPADADDTALYLDRLIGYTGAHPSGAEAASALRARRIALHAPAAIAAPLKALLDETTGGTATLVDDETALPDTADLLVVISAPGSADPAPLFARANRNGLDALNIEISAAGARIGPHVMARRTASYACYRAVHTPVVQAFAGEAPDPSALRFWSALAVHIAVSTLARAVKLPSFNAFTDYRWEKGRQVEKRTSIARLHGWDEDGLPFPLPLRRDQEGYEGWKQYCGVALQSSEASAPNAYLVHYKAENIRSIYERVPAIYSGSVTKLPDVLASPSIEALARPQGGRLGLGTLATIATYCAGFGERDGLPQRMAPTGGNLGSTLLLFLVRDVDGIAPGAYWYDGQKRAFERLANVDEAAVSRRFGFDPALPAVMVSFGNVAKVARKYGAFSFNISWYDSGVLLAYARNLAEALGLGLTDLARPDQDLLLDSLGLPASTLIPTGMLGLAPAAKGAGDAGPDAVASAMRRRRGVRAWARPDVATATVEAMLPTMKAALARYGEISTHRLNLSLLLALKLSDGLDGLYVFRPETGLELLAPLPRTQHGRLLSQVRLTESPIIVLPNVDLGAAAAAVGDCAVESSYKAAGAVVGELWLKGGGIGLVGTACGGAFDGDIRSISGRHGLDHFAPLALCLGPAPAPGGADSPAAATVSA